MFSRKVRRPRPLVSSERSNTGDSDHIDLVSYSEINRDSRQEKKKQGKHSSNIENSSFPRQQLK